MNQSDGVRINKYLSEAGVCSRREGDRMLEEGRIYIDGLPAKPGMRVMSGQIVTVDGKKISKEEEEISTNEWKPIGPIERE